MARKKKHKNHDLLYDILLFIAALGGILISLVLIRTSVHQRLAAQQQQGSLPIKLQTPIPTPSPTMRPYYSPTPTIPGSHGSNPLPTGGPPITGGPNVPDTYYCIDDADPEPCDDNTSFWVRKGVGGLSASCGTVIQWAQAIVAALPQAPKVMRTQLSTAISNACHSTGTYSSGYLSTFFVIDSYNLAGFQELSKNNPVHIVGSSLLNWWQTTPSYKFIPYYVGAGTLQQQNLTGYVLFLNVQNGVHMGIINSLEVDSHGNGIISILQAGTPYWLDRFEVVGWNIMNTPLHQTQISGVAGFGGH